MTPAKIEIGMLPDGAMSLIFSGTWSLSNFVPSPDTLLVALQNNPQKVCLSTQNLVTWDSSLLSAVYTAALACQARAITFEYSNLPEGLERLLRLALAVPPKSAPPAKQREPWVARVGSATLKAMESAASVATFIGEVTVASFRLISGRSKIRRADFLEIVIQAGPDALGIVSLISVLVGLILAYIGAIQLRQFGAQLMVADLVGIAMAREMAGIMVGIILAGRTGAAFAAQLGSMQVNEEIDALRTLGISPIESLVLPRMIALVAMIPLLCLYSILAGIIGGVIVSVGVLDLPLSLYWSQTVNSLHLADILVGVGKSFIFGALVALCGCYYGMQCGRSASAVGQATTAAVVSSIVCVVVADAIFAILCDMVGI